MRVVVFVPTTLRTSLVSTLESLKRQTLKDFETVLIVKGERPNLPYRVIVQKGGLFEEAMNLALRAMEEMDVDIALFTDDDAVPSRTWVEEHLEFHETSRDFAVVSGTVIGKKWKNYPNSLFRRFKGTKFMEPLPGLEGYTDFVTKVGLSVDGGSVNGMLSVAIVGANMSLKAEPFYGFRLPTYSIRGSYNETLLALRAIIKGYKSGKFDGAEVRHLDGETLSRTSDPEVEKYLCTEKHAFPFAVNRVVHLDVDLLEEFVDLIPESAQRLGLELALRGIKEGYSDLRFREELERIKIRNLECLWTESL